MRRAVEPRDRAEHEAHERDQQHPARECEIAALTRGVERQRPQDAGAHAQHPHSLIPLTLMGSRSFAQPKIIGTSSSSPG